MKSHMTLSPVLLAQLARVAQDAGMGNVDQLLTDLADGHLAVIGVDEDFDPAVVRWLREQAAGMDDRDYLPGALLGIAGSIERALTRKRRREREEMDALNAEANPLD